MIADLVVLFLPAYVANAMPVLLGGKSPMDFKIRFLDGNRLLGNGKTIQGFLAGISSGICVGFILSIFYQPFNINPKTQFLIAILMSIGAMVGDSFGSFIKRRLNLEGESPFIDQIPFILFAFLFSLPYLPKINIIYYLLIIILTYFIHKLANMLAYYIGIKKVPW